MRHGTFVLGIVAAAGVAASIYLGSELSATHAQLAAAEQARRADADRIRQLEEERHRLQASMTIARPPFSGATASAPASSKATGVAEAPGPENGQPPPRFGRAENSPSTPAEQNMRRLQQEIRLRRTYADMPAALGLSANQADKLFNLLADSQVTLRDEMRSSDADRQSRQALQDTARQQRDAAIEDLLGPAKAAEFQSFEKSIPARMQVGRIGESMAAANVPLSESQRNSLIAVVIAEQEAGPPPSRDESSGPDDADFQARFLDWQADYSSRVQARVEPLLTAEQASQYRQAVEVQNARRAAARARAENARNSAPR